MLGTQLNRFADRAKRTPPTTSARRLSRRVAADSCRAIASELGPGAVVPIMRPWQKVAWAYYKQALAALRYFYRYVVRQGEVVEDVLGPRSEKKLPVVLSPAEVARFFHAIPSLKYRTVLMIAYGAGLRISEAIAVRLADIDRERQVLRVRQGKGKKDRYTTLSPALLAMIDRYCWAAQPEDLLFTTRWKDRPITDSTLQRAGKAAQQAAGLDKATIARSPITLAATGIAQSAKPWPAPSG